MAVQIGDVMVHPSQRGVLTRTGPFQIAAATFIEQQIGFDRPNLLAFGFPEDKAVRLGQRIGLYAQVDSMTEIRWSALRRRSVLQAFARPVSDSNAAVVDKLWEEMKRALENSIIGVRDWAFVRSRYLMHPLQPYSVFLVRRRFSGAAVGVVVLRDRQEEGVELVDIVAPPERFQELLDVGRRYAEKLGRAEVFTWITTSHRALLAATEGRQIPLSMVIPVTIWSPGPTPDELRGHWWLMAGDTDFR